jgi:hypothetical protein
MTRLREDIVAAIRSHNSYSLLSNSLKGQDRRTQHRTKRNGNEKRVQNIIKILFSEHFEIKNWMLVGDTSILYYSPLLVQLNHTLKEKTRWEGHQGCLVLARQRPGSPGTCNLAETGLPGLPMS